MNGPHERRIRLTLHYDGSRFFGWQAQPNARTVQSEVQSVLSRLTDRPTTILAAGRTDRGVHATGQVASALVPATWSAQSLRRALNALLPDDIWVEDAEEVPLSFHARYDAVARCYRYRVGTEELACSPFHRHWCWPLARPLDLPSMNTAAELILGEHSFLRFAKAGQPERGDRCTVTRASWTRWPDLGVEFRITANRFLHHMVRYLVGTMVDIGRERRPGTDMAALLAGTENVEASPPAPAHGLSLVAVAYDMNHTLNEDQ